MLLPGGGGRGLSSSDSPAAGGVRKSVPAVGKDLHSAMKGLSMAGPQVPVTTGKDPETKKGTKGKK